MLRRALLVLSLIGVLVPLTTLAGWTPVGPNVQVTDAGPGESNDARQPDVAIRDGKLYAAWLDARQGSITQPTIYFARSDDDGASWSANTRASSLAFRGFIQRPVISVAPDGSIWIAWWMERCLAIDGACGGQDRSNDVMLALSTDGGQSFAEYFIDGNDEPEINGYPEIATTGERTLLLNYDVVDRDSVNVLLDIITRTGSGRIDIRTVQVSEGLGNGRITDPGALGKGPRMALAMHDGTVCAAWEDRRARFAIFGACSTDGGQTFGPNVQISGSDSFAPRLAFGPDGTLYAAYRRANNEEILLRRSRDNGATWDEPNPAFALAQGQDIPSYDLDVSPGGAVLLTFVLQVAPGSGTDLLLATSLDGGRSFALGNPLENVQGQYPGVAVQNRPNTVVGAGPAGRRAFVVWDDSRNVRNQIWSTRVNLDENAPTAPPNLTAQPGDTSILLTWEPATDPNGVAGYHVLRAPSPDGPYAQITPRLVTTNFYRDVGLDAQPYFYRVYAVDGVGNVGPRSNVATAAATIGTDLRQLWGTIAYQVEGGIAVRAIASSGLGSERVIGPGESPVFSHDGRRLLAFVSRDGQNQVLSRLPDGSDPQVLFADNNLAAVLDSTADPDTMGLVLFRIVGGAFICTVYEPGTVHLPAATTRFRVPFIIAEDMSVSSDGSLLAYTYRAWCNGVARGVTDSASLCVAVTANDDARTCLDSIDAEASDFVPNSSTLVFSANLSGQRELWRAGVQPDGKLINLTQLTRGPAGQPSLSPKVSTDGNWVIFVRDLDPGPGENPVLHVVRLDGDGLRALGIVGKAPAWSGGGPAPQVAPGAYRAMLPLVVR